MTSSCLNIRWLIGITLISWLFLSEAASSEIQQTDHCYLDGISNRSQCGFVNVAENPSQPNGKKIQIHYAVLPAVKPLHPDEAFLAIAGGPGQSAIDNASSFESTFKKIRETRDILLIDQRGTGRSNLLQCSGPEDSNQSPLTINERDVDTLAEARKCLQQLDADVSMYNSSVAIHDFEAVRQVLGYKKLHLYGISYGSRMAQLYMRHYSDALATVTLDGVVPMQQSVIAVGLSVDRALQGVLDECADDPVCASKYPNLNQTLDELNRELHESPIRADIFHPLTGEPDELLLTRDKVLGILRLSMYSPATRSLLPLAIQQAAQGIFQPMLGLYSLMLENIDMAAGMHNAVVCAEDLHRIDDNLKTAIKGSYMASSLYQQIRDACSVWPSNLARDDFFQPVASDIPTLLLSGELDPATPPDWGTMAMTKMTNARHLIAPHASHGVASQTCGNRLVAELVENGDIENIEGDCLEDTSAKEFYLNPSSAQPVSPKKTGEDIL